MNMTVRNLGARLGTGMVAFLLLVGLFGIAPAANASTFDVVLTQPIDSKTAQAGDLVTAQLLDSIRVSGRRIPEGSVVTGRIVEAHKARHLLMAEVSPKRWLRPGGGLAIEFDSVTTGDGTSLPMCGVPTSVLVPGAQFASYGGPLNPPVYSSPDQPIYNQSTFQPFDPRLENSSVGSNDKAMKINVKKNGDIESPKSLEMKPKATRLAIGCSGLVTSHICPIIAPAVGGMIGALKPSSVLGAPADARALQHRRVKGMLTGMVSGVPGGFLLVDAVLRGHELVLRPGTRMTVSSDAVAGDVVAGDAMAGDAVAHHAMAGGSVARRTLAKHGSKQEERR